MKKYNFLKYFDYDKFIKNKLLSRYVLKDKIKNYALLIIDMQNIFCKHNSRYYIPSVKHIIESIELLRKYFNKNNIPVFYTRHINTSYNANMMGIRYKRLIKKQNKESQLIDTYNKKNNNIIEKTQFNAFYKSELEKQLKDKNIKTLIITGIMSERCISTTAREGFVRGYRVILPIDAITTYYEEVYKASIISLAHSVADICLTEELIEKIL